MLSKKLKVKLLCIILSVFTLATSCFALVNTFFPRKYLSEISLLCEGLKIKPALVLAVIKAESSFKKDKISDKGAIGLMQIMPDTAKYISDTFFAGENYDLLSENDNLLYGVTYINYLYGKFPQTSVMLCAYNAGEGRVTSWLNKKEYSKDGKSLSNIPFKETENYLKKVNLYFKIYGFLLSF